MIRKESRKYYFSVEGETERWYLEWLQNKINEDPASLWKSNFDIKIQKDPVKRARSINIITKVEIFHVVDYESNDDVHTGQFIEALDKMKKAMSDKQIKYSLGYSNYTFELWMVLHKTDCNKVMSDRTQYLPFINKAYGKHYDHIEDYKREDNFKKILSTLTLKDVDDAINRSRIIMQKNKDNGLVQHEYKSFKYYKENPSLSIWQVVETILIQCRK